MQNLQLKKVKINKIRKLGKRRLYNIRMENEPHNYILSSGLISKNSHSVSYAYLTYKTAYLKCLYLEEYISAMINARSNNKSTVSKYIEEATSAGLEVRPPSIEGCSQICQPLENGYGIRVGMDGIRYVNSNAASAIEELVKKYGPFDSLTEFIWAYINNYKTIYTSALYALAKIGFFDPIAETTEDGKPNRNWIVINIENIKKESNKIMKRKTLNDEEKKNEVFNIEMLDCEPMDKNVYHKEELYHLGFSLSESAPFLDDNKERLERIKDCDIKTLSDASRVAMGEDSRLQHWMFVTVACQLFIVEESKRRILYMEDGHSIAPVVSYKKAEKSLKKTLEELGEANKTCLVRGRIRTNKTKQGRNEFQVANVIELNKVDSFGKAIKFMTGKL